jgi:hypothetical protein
MTGLWLGGRGTGAGYVDDHPGPRFLTPVNVFVCLELQNPEPDLNKIAVWMQRYFYAVALQELMQVAIIVVMTRFRIGA